MPFIVSSECKCCTNFLWHCQRCWNKFHNGIKHDDYITPDFYGHSMMSKEVYEKMFEIMGEEFNKRLKILPDKQRKYEEGMYGH